jgi:hypothetical protein
LNQTLDVDMVISGGYRIVTYNHIIVLLITPNIGQAPGGELWSSLVSAQGPPGRWRSWRVRWDSRRTGGYACRYPRPGASAPSPASPAPCERRRARDRRAFCVRTLELLRAYM